MGYPRQYPFGHEQSVAINSAQQLSHLGLLLNRGVSPGL